MDNDDISFSVLEKLKQTRQVSLTEIEWLSLLAVLKLVHKNSQAASVKQLGDKVASQLDESTQYVWHKQNL